MREIASFSRTFPEMSVSCIGGFVLQRGDMSAVTLLSFNEAPPEARLTLYIVYPSAGTMSPSFIETGIPRLPRTSFENANRTRRRSYESLCDRRRWGI